MKSLFKVKLQLYPIHDAVYISSKGSRGFTDDVFGAIVSPILSGVSSILSVFVKTLAKTLVNILKNVFPGVYDVLMFAQSAFRTLYNAVLRTTLNVLYLVTNTATTLLRKTLKLINNVISTIFRVLNAILSNVTALLQTIASLSKYANQGLSLIFSHFQNTIDGLTTKNTLYGNLGINRTVEYLKNSAYDGLTMIGNLYTPFVNGIDRMRIEIYKLTNSIIDRCIREFSKTFSPILEYLNRVQTLFRVYSDNVQMVMTKVYEDSVIFIVRIVNNTTEEMSKGLSVTSEKITNDLNEITSSVKNIKNNITHHSFENFLTGVCVAVSVATLVY